MLMVINLDEYEDFHCERVTSVMLLYVLTTQVFLTVASSSPDSVRDHDEEYYWQQMQQLTDSWFTLHFFVSQSVAVSQLQYSGGL